jgi:hypothetical protein
MLGRTVVVFAAVLTSIAPQIGAAETPDELIVAARTAIAEDDYAQAQDILAKAAFTARGNASLKADVAELRRTTGDLQKEFAKLERERDRLQKSPADADANQALGEFYAFMKGDWEQGLPFLARGDEELTQAAASFDLQNPSTLKDRLEAGDRWQEVARQNRDADVSSKATLRARHWYLSAVDAASGDAGRSAIDERLDQLRLYPTKLVIVNSHNGHYNDRGTLLVEVVFILDDKPVLNRRITLPWKKGESLPTTVRIPRTEADAIQVNVLKWHGLGGSLAEIEAFQDDVNLALGAPATASGEHDKPYRAENVTDGDYGGEFEQGGIWVLPDNEAGWVRVSFDRS